ncbi:MAG: tetratricopeptide repeat protein [Phycisphaeraceae bacterium]|nr:tetratricopeptide repeat protein [Phycisphaeraceae bacterium]
MEARLAEAYAATGRHERARQLFLRELRRDPGDIETLLDLGSLLVEMNRLPDAGEKFRRVLEIQPDHAEAHFRLGDLAELMGNAAEAMVHFDIVLRLNDGYPGVRRRLASLMLDRGDDGDADDARRMLEAEFTAAGPGGPAPADGEDDVSREAFGTLLLDAGLPNQASEIFRLSTVRSPLAARSWHLLGVARMEAGELDEGMEHARRALRLDPSLVAPMHNLAMAHLQLGNFRRARYWVRQALRSEPDDSALRRLRLRLNLHSVGEAIVAAWRVAVRRRPEWNAG